MKNKINLLPSVLLMLVCTGCFSPKTMLEEYFGVESVKYHASGILEINGHYQESAWGVKEITGKVDKDVIILSGVAEFGCDGAIASRMEIPGKINEVRFGNIVLWKRGQNGTVLPQRMPPNR